MCSSFFLLLFFVFICRKADAHDFIMEKVLGYKSPMSEAKLSGGERQRLTLARVILKNPKVKKKKKKKNYNNSKKNNN